MKIAICDDDKAFVNEIDEYLKAYSRERGRELEIFTFSSSDELLKSDIKFNIAILDVEMPNCSGIELGKSLSEKNRHIVLMYITAYKKYLDEALNLNAARFFEKPIDLKRFYDGLDNIIKRIDNTTIKLFLNKSDCAVRIDAQDIIYVETQSIGQRKTKIVTENETYFSSNKLAFWEEKLIPSIFVRTHKSFIVNLNYVTRYDRNCVALNNKYNAPISRSYQAAFNKSFVKYMAGV